MNNIVDYYQILSLFLIFIQGYMKLRLIQSLKTTFQTQTSHQNQQFHELIVNNFQNIEFQQIIFYLQSKFFFMNRQTPKEMLAFLISSPKKPSAEKGSPHHYATTRQIPLSKNSDTKDKCCRKYYQHKVKPIDIIQPPIEIEGSLQLNQYSETANKKINNLPPQRLSHKLFQRNGGALLQFDQNHSSQHRISKKRAELTPFRYTKMNSNDLQKREDTVPKTDFIAKNRGYLLKRVVKNPSCQHGHGNKSYSTPAVREINYYIPQVKKSVHEFMSNRQYVNPHLNHFIDSLSAFQSFAYATVPKEPHKSIYLPPTHDQKLTIIFDLDETLIHTQVMNWDTPEEDMGWGKTVDVCTDNGDYRINLKIRPHVIEVLNRLKEKFELGIFTASQEHYGSKILEEIDPDNSIFSFKLYRQHCFEMHSRCGHIKDLRIFKNRDLSRVILVDNSPHTYLFQKNNAIPIISFFNDLEDCEMLKLEKFLEQLKDVKDVRPFLKDYFRLDQYHHYNNMMKLVKELY